MSLEMTLLVWSAVLVAGYVLVQSGFYRLDFGILHAGGARDNDRAPSVMNGRAERALRNLLETYGVFIALAVATELTGRSESLTQWGAMIWFGARCLYLPAYLINIPFLRSAIWVVSAIGLIVMFFGVAF